MGFNYEKLLGRIKEKCGTHENFAHEMKLGRVSISQRLNNRLDFGAREIKKACEVLEIPENEIPQYFFCEQSSETRTA